MILSLNANDFHIRIYKQKGSQEYYGRIRRREQRLQLRREFYNKLFSRRQPNNIPVQNFLAC